MVDTSSKNAVFYPFAVTTHNKGAILAYGNKSSKGTNIFLSKSENGLDFVTKHAIKVVDDKGKIERFTDCDTLSFFAFNKKYYLMYDLKIRGKKCFRIAKSTDLTNFEIVEKDSQLPAQANSIVTEHKHNKKSFLSYYGNDSIYVAASSDLSQWHTTGELLAPRKGYFDDGTLHAIGSVIVERGIFVLYQAKRKKGAKGKITIGGALFSFDRPYIPIWRSDVPIWEEVLNEKKHPERFLGATIIKDSLHVYLATPKHEFFVKTIDLSASGLVSDKNARKLKRHHANPILKPKAQNGWENDATFNPAALYLDNKIHLIYRAIGAHGISVFGYASSNDGLNIHERLDHPIFSLAKPLEIAKRIPSFSNPYVSGGSWAGCEDPRITRVGNRIYMTYVMFDGCNAPGVGLTSISVKDFLNKNWKWKKPMFISKPGEIQKNWMVFPEKINGKYAILHSITPKISIEYTDKMHDKLVIESMKLPGVDEHRWDNIVRGAGAPPLRTKYGWLVLYHAMDKKDPNRYKVGAMLLDHDDPTKILHRSKHPILEPIANYENHGAKSGVVYVCGAVIKENTLFVYYGGADSVVCVATEDLEKFLQDMMKSAVSDSSTLLSKLKKPN
jgi:predicted GH43/DUF377 family glycosyl hydrolase